MKCPSSEERLVEKMGTAHRSARFAYRDCCSTRARNRRQMTSGFTMLELMIVVIILGIAAVTAIPMMSSAGSIQLRSAANKLAADLAYAKSLAISRGQDYAVVFDVAAESYQLEDSLGFVVEHPVKRGKDYVVDMAGEGLDRVDITSADFNGSSRVQFDCLGSPDNTAVGTVQLQAAGMTMTVSVEPVTGYISIN